MATPSAIPTKSLRDTVKQFYRITREKRSLGYQLSVLQQPERARACGAGSKAYSDRRPVDPPPVIELRIIEGDTIETGKDITFDYNANFLLFASLENSRPIAHGRVQTAGSQSPPILTGVPASGMAYLGRPIRAGYFIFPDLSISHEGNYRLNFSLFEEAKEHKDCDDGMPESSLPPGFDYRIGIKTKPFQVFGTKKFPGLMESTSLSRCIADQGCRVRIRRGVRRRTRDNKHHSYKRREEKHASRAPGLVTPANEDPHDAVLRAHSHINSIQQRAPLGSDSYRRPSVADAYAPPPLPGYDSTTRPSRAHLTLDGPNVPQYTAPRQHLPYIAPVLLGGPYTSTRYATSIYSGYPPIQPHSRLGSGSVAPVSQDGAERKPAIHAPSSPGYSPMGPRSRRDSGASHPPNLISGPSKPAPLNSSYSSRAALKIAALVSPSLPVIEAQTEPDPPAPVISTGKKRKHEKSYPSPFYQSSPRLHNGQRPQGVHCCTYIRLSPEPLNLSYCRADGSRVIPQFNRMKP